MTDRAQSELQDYDWKLVPEGYLDDLAYAFYSTRVQVQGASDFCQEVEQLTRTSVLTGNTGWRGLMPFSVNRVAFDHSDFLAKPWTPLFLGWWQSSAWGVSAWCVYILDCISLLQLSGPWIP